MITLRLVLAPESKKINLDDDATVDQLFETACKTFGVSSCTLLFGYPPRPLTRGNDTLLSVGIQSQDRIQVKTEKQEVPTTHSSSIIPGLTKDHYTKTSAQSTSTPKLVSSQRLTSSPSSFHFRWSAPGSRGESYALEAKGDILGKQELSVHCECVAFSKRGENQTKGKTRVCKHLHAALNSVIDSSATINKETKNEIDLMESDSSGSEKESKKRPATASIAAPKRKRIRTDTPCNQVPLYLSATPFDEALRRHAPRTHPCFTHCKTLPEMVFGENQTHLVKWMVVSNFLIEFNYLVDVLPQLLTVPRLVFFHSDKQPNPSVWPGTGQADFVQLNPGADPQTQTNPSKYRFEFGSHHTKLFLVGYQNKIRVVVSTSNLRRGDAVKANAAYIEEFPIKNDSELNNTSDFEESLVYYIRSYGYRKKQNWMGTNQHESLAETLQRYDYSQAKAVLIPSVPGYHNIDDKTPRLGQLKVRQAIQKYTTPNKSPQPVVCQFSSIGSLSESYLHTIQTSMDTCLAQSETKGQSLQLKFVYPTVEEIRTSVEGYPGGDSVPGRAKNVSKAFLRPMWHKWTAPAESSSNPLMKPKNVPHIKSYYQTNKNNGLDWLVVTSHNISQPAWGTIRNNKKYGGQHLYIRSWELGVFVSPGTLGIETLVPFTGKPASDGTATVPVPYATHALERYGQSDQPWACDSIYQRPDAAGYHSCMGHTSPNP